MRLQEEENDNTKQNQEDASGFGRQYLGSGNVIFEMACMAAASAAPMQRAG